LDDRQAEAWIQRDREARERRRQEKTGETVPKNQRSGERYRRPALAGRYKEENKPKK